MIVFYQLAFLAATFFTAGAICLGGALMRIPQYDPQPIRQWITQYNDYTYKVLEGVERRLDKEIAKVRQDSGEAKGALGHNIDLLRQLIADFDMKHAYNNSEQQKLIDKIGHDLYAHFSLQMKKPKGTRK